MEDEKLILANRSIWKEMLIYDPKTNMKEVIPRRKIAINGDYEQNDRLIMIFKYKDRFYFCVDEKKICLSDEDVTVSFVRNNAKNEFSIFKKGKKEFSIIYNSWRFDPLNLVDPSFNDDMEEAQDIYLFIYNLMGDAERQKRIF